MVFSSTITFRTVIGNKRLVVGTFTNAAGDAGGEIDTGLVKVQAFVPSFSSHLGSEAPKISISSGTVTIVTSEAVDGYFIAIGV